MSSILKALKKLEDDKATRRPDELRIDAEILRPDIHPKFTSTGVILTYLLLLAGGSGATYMYMKHGKAPEPGSSKSPVISSRQSQANVSDASNIKTEQPPAAVVIVPANQNKTKKKETPEPHQPPMSIRTAPETGIKTPAKLLVAPKPVDVTKAPQAKPPRPSTTDFKSMPAIRVNGIAFQDRSADSMAIINGVPVTNGSVIDGVKIEEINKNKVIFSYNGERFEIQLGQSNR